jgi:hypothetical protein
LTFIYIYICDFIFLIKVEGKIVLLKAAAGSFDKIVTNGYSEDIIELIHKMMNIL